MGLCANLSELERMAVIEVTASFLCHLQRQLTFGAARLNKMRQAA